MSHRIADGDGLSLEFNTLFCRHSIINHKFRNSMNKIAIRQPTWHVLTALIGISVIFVAISQMATYANSDFLMLEHLYRDLIIESGKVKDWHLPGALYFIDTLLYFTFRAVSQDMHTAFSMLITLQLLLLTTAATLTAKHSSSDRLFIFANILPFTWILATNGSSILSPYCHGITFPLATICGILLTTAAPSTSVRIAIYTAMATLIASDKFTLLYLTIPHMALTFIATIRHRSESKLHIRNSILCMFFAAFGIYADGIIRSTPPPMGSGAPRLSRLAENIPAIFNDFLHHISIRPSIGLIWLIGLISLVYYCRSNSSRIQLSSFVAVSVFTNLLAVASTGYSYERYLLALYLLPPTIGFAYFIGSIHQHHIRNICIGSSLLLLITLAFPQTKENQRKPDADLMCITNFLENHNTRVGYAGYWDARYYTEITNSKINLAPISGHGNVAFLNLTTKRTFQNAQRNFVIKSLNAPQEEGVLYSTSSIVFLNGEPQDREVCGNKEILYYPQTIRIPTMGELLAYGPDINDEITDKDLLIWHGSAHLYDDITMTDIVLTKRWTDTMIYILTNKPYLPARHDSLAIYITGDGAPTHRKKLASLIDIAPASISHSIMKLFFEQRSFQIGQENAEALPDGRGIIYAKSPNRNLQSVSHLIIEHNGKIFRLK